MNFLTKTICSVFSYLRREGGEDEQGLRRSLSRVFGRTFFWARVQEIWFGLVWFKAGEGGKRDWDMPIKT
jgi:hypothetical protein